MPYRSKVINVLLVEDNPADARLTTELLRDAKFANTVHAVRDGVEAMNFLYRRGRYQDAPRPDIILLDLKMPKMDGHEVLEQIKNDPKLKCIPVLILTSSSAEEDISRAYRHHANCYLTKPADIDDYFKVISAVDNFWLGIVCLPSEA